MINIMLFIFKFFWGEGCEKCHKNRYSINNKETLETQQALKLNHSLYGFHFEGNCSGNAFIDPLGFLVIRS
jgi:hypothetical protein